MHKWTHTNCDNINKTYASSKQQIPALRISGGLEFLPSKEAWLTIDTM